MRTWVPSSAPWPFNISRCTTTTSPISSQSFRLFPLPVSAKSSQPPRTQNDHRKAGLKGEPVLTAFTSNAKHQSSSSIAKTKQPPSSSHDSSGQQKPLSGSDVLLALKRATAEKANNKKRNHVSPTSKARSDGNGEDKTPDYSSFRPLTIKTEWSARLEQLEKRLEQLMEP